MPFGTNGIAPPANRNPCLLMAPSRREPLGEAAVYLCLPQWGKGDREAVDEVYHLGKKSRKSFGDGGKKDTARCCYGNIGLLATFFCGRVLIVG